MYVVSVLCIPYYKHSQSLWMISQLKTLRYAWYAVGWSAQVRLFLNIHIVIFILNDEYPKGNRANKVSRSSESIGPGECTLHARKCAGGVGIYYLLQHFTVLLVRDSRCCYYPQLSLYLDSSGEVSQSRAQNRPMFLSSKRHKQVENLYLSHSIAKEVVRTRSMEDRYIRQYYY